VRRLGSPLVDRRSAYLIVGFLVGSVYLNALPNLFAYDDMSIVVTNSAIQSLSTLPEALVQPYWPGDYGRELGLWRPATTLILGLEYVVGGGSPLLFHIVNVLGHIGATLLVLGFLLELMSLPAALAGGLVFAVHPVHVEAVANVIGISELISTSAIIAACLVHIRGGMRSGWWSAGLVGVLYLIGFGAKESAVTLPGLIFLVDAVRRRITVRDIPEYLRDRWRVYVVMAVVAGALLAARYAILGSIASPFAPLGADLLAEVPRIWTLSEIWMHYVRLWIFPLDLSSDYSPGVIPISLGWNSGNVVGVVLAIVLFALAFFAWRRPFMEKGVDTGRATAFGLVWFTIAISPISNTLFLSGVLLAERTLYLPSVGLAAATGWIVVRFARDRPRGAWILLAFFLSLSAVRSWTRTPTWNTNSTVLTALIRDYPQSGRSQWVLGDIQLRAGRVSDGLRSYRAAINLLGPHYQLLTEISKRLLEVEHYRAAEGLLILAARDSPQYPLALGLLSLIRSEHGDAVEAERYARASIELWPVDPTRHHLLAWALAAQGRFDEAEQARRKALEQGRAVFWQQYAYQAYQYRAAGDTERAVASIDSAWAQANTAIGRATVDSVRTSEFGLPSLLSAAAIEGVVPPR
jgi:tetratricopeptide (TPR) repeat protein